MPSHCGSGFEKGPIGRRVLPTSGSLRARERVRPGGCGMRRFGHSGAVQQPTAAGEVRVSRVIDGDSVELEIDGETVEARLIGINAPELADCQGELAKDALEGIAEGLLVDLESFGDDRFDRLLVNLLSNDESINLAMVRSGWAIGQHTGEHDRADEWVKAMVEAANGGLGMWELPGECPPALGALSISGIEPDPPGPDNEVLDQEWIDITNSGPRAVDLEGWAVRDESTSNRFVLPSHELEPGATVRITTGCGEDSASEVFWCSSNGVWSNGGDTALLLGPSGSIEDWLVVD